MLKIKQLLQSLIEVQKQINKSIKELKEEIKPKPDNISINANKITGFISSNLEELKSNIYSKEETIKAFNKEYDYRKEYEECQDENNALLQLIEKYCKYNDKYEVLDLFKRIDNEYLIKKR